MASAIKIVAGLFILIIGLPIVLAGSAILLIVPIFTDSQGYFMTSSINVGPFDGYAAVRYDIPLDDIQIGVGVDPSNFITLKMNARDASGNDVLAGILLASEADELLASVNYIQITNLRFLEDFEFGSRPTTTIEMNTVSNATTWAAPDPNSVNWLLRDTDQTFEWAPTLEALSGGSLAVVLMHANYNTFDSQLASHVQISFSVGARVPIVGAIGWILVIVGGLFTLLAVIVLWSGIRSKKAHPQRVRYYYGAPTQRVDPIARTEPKYQLQCSNCGSLNEPDSAFCSQCGEILLSEDRTTVDKMVTEKKLEVFEPTGEKLVVADGWSRFWSWLIDLLIVGAIANTLTFLFFFGIRDWSLWSSGPLFVSFTPTSVFMFLYFLFMETYYGQTLGKMILKLEVVAEETGQRPTPGQIALSALGKAFFLPIDVILGWFVKDKDQIPDLEQRATQKWARVVVVRQQQQKDAKVRFISSRVG
ncbi:MAG: RDD family protein [Candidatus Heimdallarchaeota archaeon]